MATRQIEAALDRPVVNSSQAVLWGCVKPAGKTLARSADAGVRSPDAAARLKRTGVRAEAAIPGLFYTGGASIQT